MREITREMIKEFKLKKYKYDFMGYDFKEAHDLTFHHLIVPRRETHELDLGQGYLRWNGAILGISHSYIHLIEAKDPEIYYKITRELVDENIKGCLDIADILRIHDMLEYFEREHDHDTTCKGKLLIKREYVEGRHKF